MCVSFSGTEQLEEAGGGAVGLSVRAAVHQGMPVEWLGPGSWEPASQEAETARKQD